MPRRSLATFSAPDSPSTSISTLTRVLTLGLERDDAVVFDLALDRPSGDLLVRPLLGDLGRPLTAFAADVGNPVDMSVVHSRLSPPMSATQWT
jgi:hypothetical protein